MSLVNIPPRPDRRGQLEEIHMGSPGFQTSVELDRLAARIRANHAALIDAANDVVDRAMAAGDDLIEAKSHIGTLPWADWLDVYCGITDRAARNYAALAKNRATIEGYRRRNGRSAPALGIKAALRLIGHAPDRAPGGTRAKPQLPSGRTFNNASVEDRRAFLADLVLIKLLEALPLRMRAELQRRAGYKGKTPSDVFSRKLSQALKTALSSAAMKTPEGKNSALAAINGINNLLSGAGLDLHDVEIAIHAKDARRAA